MLKVLFFARLKDQLNMEELELEANFANVAELQAYLIEQKGMNVLQDDTIRVALNQRFCKFEQEIKAGDEIAFMPPVTGG